MDLNQGEDQLGQQRPQAGEGGAQRTGIEQPFLVFDPYPVEARAAAVGLALAVVVPVVEQLDAGTAGGYHGDQQASAVIVFQRGKQQQIRIQGATAKALLAIHLPGIAAAAGEGTAIQGIEGIAPEQTIARGALQPGSPLRGLAEQLGGGQQQVMEAEDVGQGAVDPGQLPYRLQRLFPGGAEAAQFRRNAQGQETALAQGIALGLGRAALTITFRRGGSEALQQGKEGVQQGIGHGGLLQWREQTGVRT